MCKEYALPSFRIFALGVEVLVGETTPKRKDGPNLTRVMVRQVGLGANIFAGNEGHCSDFHRSVPYFRDYRRFLSHWSFAYISYYAQVPPKIICTSI